MTSTDQLTVPLTSEIREQVSQGVEPANTQPREVIQEALRYWSDTRSGRKEDLRLLQTLWLAAAHDRSPGVPMDEVMDRLENRYVARVRDSSKVNER